MPRPATSEATLDAGRRLASQIRQERTRAGVSAEALARSAGLSVETVRRIERGLIPNPGFFTVAAIAGELGIELDRLREASRAPSRRKRTK